MNKYLWKHIHHVAIQDLTCLVLNKRKMDNKQPPVNPPLKQINAPKYKERLYELRSPSSARK
jgi:hypothetical protein